MTLDEIAELREGELRYAYCFAVMAVAPELIEVARVVTHEHSLHADARCGVCAALEALDRKLAGGPVCWRCKLPMLEGRVCSGSGFSLLCAERERG